ncbi:DUF2971 domain-containing protein [Rhodococcus jostii]|uniref:DUF2971 domain-containing protein n=1 Tax=Rhodococcus jostii TaxID=132919 RepID=A0A1H4IWX1_RHOJO|nr:DUF2971 domain-containing protein [Rhodococcus jostii]SEB38523.1 Protein of unknown function [Rhodococcus jostii]
MSDETPKTLHHYTDSQGLLGILQNRNFWATDTRYLNDTQELRHGCETMVAALRKAADQQAPAGEDAEAKEAAVARTTALRFTATALARGQLFDTSPHGGAYVTCFCEGGDQLGQWRGYGANGGGFAIGFRTDALAELAHELKPQGDDKATAPLPKPQRVLYHPKDLERRCATVVEKILSFGANAAPFSAGGFDAIYICLPALAFMKHDAFQHENEWRVLLINRTNPNLKFRSGALGVIPYVEIGFPAHAVAEVVVGPGPHPELRKQAVEQLLDSEGYEKVPVRLSTVPYRP